MNIFLYVYNVYIYIQGESKKSVICGAGYKIVPFLCDSIFLKF